MSIELTPCGTTVGANCGLVDRAQGRESRRLGFVLGSATPQDWESLFPSVSLSFSLRQTGLMTLTHLHKAVRDLLQSATEQGQSLVSNSLPSLKSQMPSEYLRLRPGHNFHYSKWHESNCIENSGNTGALIVFIFIGTQSASR